MKCIQVLRGAVCGLMIFGLAAPAHAEPASLAQPTVVSTAWVARRGSALVLLDTREKPEDFAAGHLPSARPSCFA